ncbi:MAG: hypothetical protein ACXWN8_05750, partial [Isosphaeraceae bacterium]
KSRQREPLPAIEESRNGSSGSAKMAHFLTAADSPARLDSCLEPRRSAGLISALATHVLISALATGPRQGWAAGSDRFWLLELGVSQHFSTFYGSFVQAIDTQLGARRRRRIPTIVVRGA